MTLICSNPFTLFLVHFALQPKAIRQTLLKERYKNAERRQRERMLEHGRRVNDRHQLLYYTLTFGAGLDHNICMNTFRNLFGVFRKSWSRLTEHCSNYVAGPMVHGNTGRANRSITCSVALAEASVVEFLSEVSASYGEPYATRFVRSVTGMSLRNEEVDAIELPSHFKKRKLYAQYCCSRGYKVKASAKGSYGKISDYEVRDVDGVYWLPESVPEPVCSWKDFLVIWKKEFPHLKIRNACEDTCGECFKIKNSFYFWEERIRLHNQRATGNSNAASASSTVPSSINELGDSDGDASVRSSAFAMDEMDNDEMQLYGDEEFPLEAIGFDAYRHVANARSQRELATSRISESKDSAGFAWEDRRFVLFCSCTCV